MPVVVGEDGRKRRLVRKKRVVKQKKKRVVKKKRLVRIADEKQAGLGEGEGKGKGPQGPSRTSNSSTSSVGGAKKEGGGGGEEEKDGGGMASSLGGAKAESAELQARREAALAKHMVKLVAERNKAQTFEGTPSRWVMVHLVTADGKTSRRVQIHEQASGEFLLRGFADKLHLLEWEHFQLAKVLGGAPVFDAYLDAVQVRLGTAGGSEEGEEGRGRGRRWSVEGEGEDEEEGGGGGGGKEAAADAATPIPKLALQWIHNETPVLEQGVEEGDILVIMVKLYTADVAEMTCVRAISLYYLDVALRIFSHAWKVTLDQAVKLASFMVHIHQGSYTKGRDKKKTFLASSLGRFLPLEFIPSGKKARAVLRSRILHHYKAYQGMRKTLAMVNYCEFASLAAGYGATLFHVAVTASHLGGSGSLADESTGEEGMMGASGTLSASGKEEGSGEVQVMAVIPSGLALYDAAAWDAASAESVPDPVATYTFESDIETTTYHQGTLDVALSSGSVLSIQAFQSEEGEEEELVASVEPMAHAEEMLRGYLHFFLLGGRVATPGASKRRRTAFNIRISLPSGEHEESVGISQSTLGSKVFREYADRLGLRNRKAFGLCESTLDNDRWLDLSRPLVDQFVTKRTRLVFKIRYFFFTPQKVSSEEDEVATMALFDQVRQAILDGYYLVTEQEAVDFAALSCFANNGAFDRSIHSSSMLVSEGLRHYIPAWLRPKRKDKEWCHMIFSPYRKMGDIGAEVDAHKAYLLKALEISTFGITYFPVLSEDEDDLLLGVAKAGLVVFTRKHFKKLHVFSYRDLKVKVTPAAVMLEVMVKEGEVDPLLGRAPSHWEEHLFYVETPLESKSIEVMAATYYQVAFMRARARARAQRRQLSAHGGF